MKTRHLHTHEHFNLAGEYNTAHLETAPADKTIAPPKLSLDEYVSLVREFGSKCATTYVRKRRPYDELDEILMRIDPV